MAGESLQDIPNVTLSVSNVGFFGGSASGGGGGGGGRVNVSIRGPDLAELSRISGEVLEEMKQLPTLQDVDTSLNVGNPEVQIAINREKEADLGASVADISDAMRLFLSGAADITKYKEGDELYEVRLRVRPDQRRQSESLAGLMVPAAGGGGAGGGLVRLDNVARITRGSGPAQIDRYNRQRQVVLAANLTTGAPLGEALDQVRGIITQTGLPPGYDYAFLGFGRFFAEAISSFLLAFFLSFIFMYMVLAAQFESFVHPITILASLPLAIPFALLSLFLAGKTLQMYAAIGILLLFGIVKKNSILQIDFTNRLRREEGYDRERAILEANRARLRPILMTTLSIVAAMIPTMFGTGPGSGSRAPIAVVIAGGQTLCFLLTLLAIPVVYTILDDLAQFRFRERAQAWRLALARNFSGFFGLQ